MRFCTSVSLVIHRYSIVRFIYIYICVYTELSFETDRSSLFVANIRIYMYRNINIYKNTKKWEWGVGRGGEGGGVLAHSKHSLRGKRSVSHHV